MPKYFRGDAAFAIPRLYALLESEGYEYAVRWTRMSCHDFDDNQVRLRLFVLAYNLGNFLRRIALPASVEHWTLTTLRNKLIKIGAKVVRPARYVTFQLAEVAIHLDAAVCNSSTTGMKCLPANSRGEAGMPIGSYPLANTPDGSPALPKRRHNRIRTARQWRWEMSGKKVISSNRNDRSCPVETGFRQVHYVPNRPHRNSKIDNALRGRLGFGVIRARCDRWDRTVRFLGFGRRCPVEPRKGGAFMKRSSIIFLSCLLAFSAIAWAEDSTSAQEVSAAKRVGPETSTEGLTVQEYGVRQAELHSWLATETPDETLVNPIRIQLSQAELNEINNPDTSKPGPLKVGVVEELDAPVVVSCQSGSRGSQITCTGDGVLRMTEDGGFLWARSVTSSGAAGIRVHLTDLSLPADADLYFYGPNGEAYGPFNGRGPNDDGDFWLPSVLADTGTIVVRHFGPRGNADLPQLRMAIGEIGHIGDGFFGGGPSPTADNDLCSYNASCVQNATCQNSGPAVAAESAAAKMLWVAGCCINICTGGLIADTDSNTEIPYFLTANHCISKNNAANNLEAFFQYDMPCGGSCPAGSFDSPLVAKTTGSSIEATSRNGDFTLLRLDQAPPAGSVYLGWDSAPIANSNGAALHRISHPSGAPQAYSEHAVDANIGTCLSTPRGEFIYSDDVFGATEGGSSGAPVVNAGGEIVGQLTGCCGVGGGNCNDVCNSNNHTIDGAFAFYFSNVESILDPAGCTPTTVACADGLDNDCDGATDCDDTNGAEDCSADPSCQSSGCANPGGAAPGTSCSSNSECCSNKCKGSPNNKTCR